MSQPKANPHPIRWKVLKITLEANEGSSPATMYSLASNPYMMAKPTAQAKHQMAKFKILNHKR